jgi:hypothetical protein
MGSTFQWRYETIRNHGGNYQPVTIILDSVNNSLMIIQKKATISSHYIETRCHLLQLSRLTSSVMLRFRINTKRASLGRAPWACYWPIAWSGIKSQKCPVPSSLLARKPQWNVNRPSTLTEHPCSKLNAGWNIKDKTICIAIDLQ